MLQAHATVMATWKAKDMPEPPADRNLPIIERDQTGSALVLLRLDIENESSSRDEWQRDRGSADFVD